MILSDLLQHLRPVALVSPFRQRAGVLLEEAVSPLLDELPAQAFDVPGRVILILGGEVGGRVDVLVVVLDGASADHAPVAYWLRDVLRELKYVPFLSLRGGGLTSAWRN